MIQHYLDYLSSEKGLAQNTLKAYRRDLLSFEAAMKEPIESVEEQKLYRYFERLKGLQSSTVARKMAAIKGFYRFLVSERQLIQHPARFLTTPKVWQKVPNALSIEEMHRLLRSIQPVKQSDFRDLAILTLLYSSGMRVSELVHLDVHHIGDKEVRVMGKGSRERMVIVAPIAVDAIDHYLGLRTDDEKALFLSSRGKRIDRMGVWRIVTDRARAAKIKKRVSPHVLRHSFATHLLENGADLRVIQELLGHSNISTTDRYTQVSIQQLQNAFDALHPRS